MRKMLAVGALLASLAYAAAPAPSQTVSGCGTAAVAKADRTNREKLTTSLACFEKAGAAATAAAQERRRLIAALPAPTPSPTPAPTPSPTATPRPVVWTVCAGEGAMCRFEGKARVRYGFGDSWTEKEATGEIACGNDTFGDPIFGVAKQCQTTAEKVTPPSEPVVVTPINPGNPNWKPPVAAGDRAWPMPGKPTTRRGQLGVNVAGTAWWNGDQTYANLLMGGEWRGCVADCKGAELDRVTGYPDLSKVSDTYRVLMVLTPPYTTFTGDDTVRCTWKGKGDVMLWGNVNADLTRDMAAGTLSFTWKKNLDNQNMNWIQIHRSDAADPIRDIDCRADGVPTVGIFTKQVVDHYARFGTLRFLDANGVNGNGHWTWATRTLPTDITQSGADGMAIEHRVALAKAANADIWDNVSYNADESYQRGMAQLYHQLLAGTSKLVYVELSNEVWNFSFGIATQLRNEGIASNVSGDGDGFKSGLILFGMRSADLFRIWTEVWKDRPGQIVRVAAGQGSNPWTGEQIIDASGLAQSGLLDAYAVAPYFGDAILQENPGVTNLDVLFPLLSKDMDRVLTQHSRNLALTKRMGVRLLSYEGGQHLIDGGDATRLAAMNRDPRMGDMYRKYLPRWIASNDNDVSTLFNATGRISGWGAWGLREYAGQPLLETPKLQAVVDFLNDNTPITTAPAVGQ